jgi:hypothetical protein
VFFKEAYTDAERSSIKGIPTARIFILGEEYGNNELVGLSSSQIKDIGVAIGVNPTVAGQVALGRGYDRTHLHQIFTSEQ